MRPLLRRAGNAVAGRAGGHEADAFADIVDGFVEAGDIAEHIAQARHSLQQYP